MAIPMPVITDAYPLLEATGSSRGNSSFPSTFRGTAYVLIRLVDSKSNVMPVTTSRQQAPTSCSNHRGQRIQSQTRCADTAVCQ